MARDRRRRIAKRDRWCRRAVVRGHVHGVTAIGFKLVVFKLVVFKLMASRSEAGIECGFGK